MKKIISVLLAVIMLLSLAAPVMAAGEIKADYPTIYIRGAKATGIYNADGTFAKSPDHMDVGAYIKEEAGPVLEDFALAVATGNYTPWIDSLAACMGYLYDGWTIDGNGDPVNGTTTKADQLNANPRKKTSNFGATDYVFEYDWRLNLMETADKLDEYVEAVLKATGATKVNIFARCLGTQPTMAYLYKSYNGAYDHEFRVANVALDTPSSMGYITLGALFSGNIKLNADSVDKFVTYFLENRDLIDDPEIEAWATLLVSILNQAEVLGLGVDAVQKIIDDCGDELVSKLALSCYGGYPAYYSMVSDEYYDEAIDTIFYTDELKAEYAGFIADTEEYHYALNNVNEETGLTGVEQLLLDLKAMGVNTAVFSKYGAMQFPLFDGCEISGDMRGTAGEMGFGATVANIYDTLSEEYIAKAEANGTAKYISADKMIDASTGLLPDTTWYIKNISHTTFPACVNAIALEFFRSNGTVTVWDSEAACGQFMDFATGALTPVEAVEDEEGGWLNNWQVILKRFIQLVLKLLVSLFNSAE